MVAERIAVLPRPEDRRGKRRIIDFDVEIGRRLRVQRVQRGISQTELADAIDLTFQQIQKYENGSNRISAGKLLQIARVLEIPVAVFFEGLEDDPRDDSARSANAAYQEIQAFAASSDGRRLYRAFVEIGKPETRRLILRMLESLSGGSNEA